MANCWGQVGQVEFAFLIGGESVDGDVMEGDADIGNGIVDGAKVHRDASVRNGRGRWRGIGRSQGVG